MGGAIHCRFVVVHTADLIEMHDLCTGKVHAIIDGYIIFAHYVCTIEIGSIYFFGTPHG